jgi:hypothetical protein
MSSVTQFGAELQLTGQETAVDTESKVAALRAAILSLAESYGRGEIDQSAFTAALKPLQADLRANEQALKIVTAEAQKHARAFAESAAAAERLRQAEAAAAAEAQAMADAQARMAAAGDLARRAELEALAIQHETEMLAHEERQLEALDATVHRIVADQEQLTAATNQTAAAIAGETAVENAQIGALEQSIIAFNRWELEQEEARIEAAKTANALWAEDHALQSFTTDVSAATAAQGRLHGGATAAAGRMSNMQMRVQAASFAFQDFAATSGDLGMKLNSISNNIPMLLAGMGGLATVVGMTATAAIALYRNWDSVSALWEERNPFPKSAQDVETLRRELDRAKESLEKMEKAGSGNAAQLERYNELRAKTAELEAKIATEQEKQARLKKLLEAPTEEQEGRAKGFAEAVKGRGQETLDTLTGALRKDQDNYIAARRIATENAIFDIRQSGKTDAEKAELIRGEWQRFESLVNGLRRQENRPEQLAKDLMDRLAQGQQGAFDQLDRLMRETTTMFGDLRDRINRANPQLKKEWEDWFGEEQKRLEEQIKETERARKEEETAARRRRARDFAREINEGMAEYREWEKTHKDEAKQETRDEDAERKAGRERLQKSGVADQAAAAYAQARARGATPDQALDLVAQQARAYIDQQQARLPRGRRMSEDQRNLLATQIASAGRKEVNQRLVGLQGQNLGATEKLLMVGQALNADLERQAAKIRELQRAAAGLFGEVNARVGSGRNNGRGG